MTNTSEKVTALLDMGLIYRKNPEKQTEAYLYFDKARKLALQLENDKVIGQSVFEQGKMLVEMGEEVTATHYFKRIVQAIDHSKYPKIIASCYTELGKLYYQNFEYEVALHAFDQAIKYLEKAESRYERAPIHVYKAQVYFDGCNYDNATDEIAQALLHISTNSIPPKIRLLQVKIAVENGVSGTYIRNYEDILEQARSEQDYTTAIESGTTLLAHYKENGLLQKALIVQEVINEMKVTKEGITPFIDADQVGYAHAYEEMKEREEEKKVALIGYVILAISIGVSLCFLACVIVSKRQNKNSALLQSMMDAQLQFVQDRMDKYVKA